MAVATQAQVDKKCYKNQTAGWLGVVKLDHLGAQVGESVKPLGTVWLTDDEARLTARAPVDPANNPFIEKNYLFYDETGATVEAPMRALVLIADPSSEPGEDRFVPGLGGNDEAIKAAQADTATALADSGDREVPSQPSALTPVPPMTTAVPAEQVPGVLRGGDSPAPIPADEARTGSPTAEPAPQRPAPKTVASAPEEEHAAHLKSGEETGAADQPSGQAPEGEYASHEEVGSPEAPSAKKKEDKS